MTNLLFLPGLMCDESIWTPVAELLRESKRVADVTIAVWRGEGSIEAMAEAVMPCLTNRTILVGHSLGARVAIEVSLRASSGVVAMGLVSLGMRSPTPEEAVMRRKDVETAKLGGMPAVVQGWADQVLSPGVRRSKLREELIEMACRMSVSDYEKQIEAFLARQPLQDILPQIATPTHLITAENDMIASPESMEWAEKMICGASLTIIKDAAHMLPLEQPEHLGNTLLNLMGQYI